MHSTLNTLISNSGGLLRSVSTVCSVASLLELEQEVDSSCVVVWYIAKRSYNRLVVIALLILVMSFCGVALVSEHFACVLPCPNGYLKPSGCKY